MGNQTTLEVTRNSLLTWTYVLQTVLSPDLVRVQWPQDDDRSSQPWWAGTSLDCWKTGRAGRRAFKQSGSVDPPKRLPEQFHDQPNSTNMDREIAVWLLDRYKPDVPTSTLFLSYQIDVFTQFLLFVSSLVYFLLFCQPFSARRSFSDVLAYCVDPVERSANRRQLFGIAHGSFSR